MSTGFVLRVSSPQFDMPELSPNYLLVGGDARLELEDRETTWHDTHFPVVELAVVVARHWNDRSGEFRFASMNMEEEPVLSFIRTGETWEVSTYDDARFLVTAPELTQALVALKDGVDALLREFCGVTLDDVRRGLADEGWWNTKFRPDRLDPPRI
jgi:hypothetical protein